MKTIIISIYNQNINIIIKIQSIIRMFLNNKRLQKLKDNFDLNIINNLLDIYIEKYKLINYINKTLLNKKIRHENFPSEISENIVKFAIFKKYKIMPNWNTKIGDLELIYKKIEIKAFSSIGPTSFGPTENWNIIYFINAIDACNKYFIIYEIKLSNKDQIWRNIKINKNQTYEDQCKQGRRPRISFTLLEKQINAKYINVIWKGFLYNL